MRKVHSVALTAVLLLLAIAVVSAETVAIVGGRVVVGDGTVLEKGTVIFEDGVIKAVGADVKVPAGARVIDATGLWVWPGMIDPYTSLGLVEVGMDRATNDTNESTMTSTAQLRAGDAINPDSAPIRVTRIGGVTTVLVSPGSRNPINGQAALIDLDGRTLGEMLVADSAAQVFNFSRSAGREESYPSTRIGIVAFIRQTLYDTRRYGERMKARESDSEEENEDESKEGSRLRRDLGSEALLAVLEGKVPVIASAGNIQEIRSALAVGDEFGLKLILLNPAHAWKMLDEIKSRNVPVLLGNTFNSPSDTDPFDRYFSLAATLREAGILFAFTTSTTHNVRNLPDHAAKAVAYGLPESEAVKALTINPAKILGIDGRAGSLAPGKVANVVLWNGNPLQIRSKVVRLFIRGEEVPLRSRQEMLRDKYQEIGLDK